MGYAVAGIIAIIAGVLAWLSATSWRWFNIALVFLIVCAASMFGFLAANTLAVHSAWRSRANEGAIKIEKEEVEKQKKLEGVRDENGKLKAGIRQLRKQVQDLIVARGPAWVGKPDRVGKDGGVQLTIKATRPDASPLEDELEAPEQSGLPAQSIVYIFEALPVPQGGAFIGEFRVMESAGSTIKVLPNLPLTEAEAKRMAATKAMWNIYLKMPADENDVYTALTDEDAAADLPKDFDESYRKGKRTEAEMTDWVFFFHDNALQRELIADQKVKLQHNIERLEKSVDDNKKDIAYRTEEKADLQFDKQGFEAERTAVTNYATALEAKAKRLAAQLAALRTENAKLAAELKTLQLKAAELINERTETAQATP